MSPCTCPRDVIPVIASPPSLSLGFRPFRVVLCSAITMPRVSLPQVLWHSKDDKHSDRVYSVDIQPSVSLQNLSLHPSFSVSAKSSSFSSSPESSSSSASFSSENHSSASSSSPPECRVPPPAGSSFRPCHPSPQSAHGLDTAPARVLLTSSNGTNLMSLSSHLHLSNSHNGVAGGGGGLLSRKEARAREKKAAILASYSRLATAGADEFIHVKNPSRCPFRGGGQSELLDLLVASYLLFSLCFSVLIIVRIRSSRSTDSRLLFSLFCLSSLTRVVLLAEPFVLCDDRPCTSSWFLFTSILFLLASLYFFYLHAGFTGSSSRASSAEIRRHLPQVL